MKRGALEPPNSVTEERKRHFTFSVPYAQSGLALVLREGLNWDGNVERITFGVKKGATGERIVRDWEKAGRRVRFETFVSNEEILINLLIKRVDAAFFDYINALYYSRIYGLEIWKELIYRIELAFVIVNLELRDRVNDFIKRRAREIETIIRSFIGTDAKW